MFLLINYHTKERLLCTWFENDKNLSDQPVYVIGNNKNKGYNQLISEGFVDRRFIKARNSLPSKLISDHKQKKWLKNNKNRKKISRFLIAISKQ